MSREIKFRAWNKLGKRWERQLCLYLDDSEIGDVSTCVHNQEDKEAYILQQFTGIKDSYGTEIYEGDIVEYGLLFGPTDDLKTTTSQILWHINAWNLAGFAKYDNYSIHFIPFPNMKIIGNILENPELIK